MPINISERCSIEMQFLISTDKIIYEKNRFIYIINMSIKNLSSHKTSMQFPIFVHSLLPGWMVFVDAKMK